MAQKYEWGWVSRFATTGDPYEEAEGFTSKAAVLQDVHRARAEEKESLEAGTQIAETEVKYTIRRRPKTEWEEVAG